jgi:hypothetical protein
LTSPRRIRTQAETHHPEVRGPAATRNQVRSVSVRIDDLGNGKLRISAPTARGWARTVRTRDELVRAVGEAFTEAQLASYARWRGEAYDHDALSDVDETDPLVASAPHIRAVVRSGRSDVHSPLDWVPLEDGTWRSPAGRVFGGDTDAVRRVKAKRAKLDSP